MDTSFSENGRQEPSPNNYRPRSSMETYHEAGPGTLSHIRAYQTGLTVGSDNQAYVPPQVQDSNAYTASSEQAKIWHSNNQPDTNYPNQESYAQHQTGASYLTGQSSVNNEYGATPTNHGENPVNRSNAATGSKLADIYVPGYTSSPHTNGPPPQFNTPELQRAWWNADPSGRAYLEYTFAQTNGRAYLEYTFVQGSQHRNDQPQPTMQMAAPHGNVQGAQHANPINVNAHHVVFNNHPTASFPSSSIQLGPGSSAHHNVLSAHAPNQSYLQDLPQAYQDDSSNLAGNGAATQQSPGPPQSGIKPGSTEFKHKNYPASVQARMKNPLFRGPAGDATIPPDTDEAKDPIVKLVITAMRDIHHTVEKEGRPEYNNRWLPTSTYYSHEDFEETARELVEKLFHVYKYGFTLRVNDDTVKKLILKTAHWKFAERLEEMLKYLRRSKFGCRDALKGDKIALIIGQPNELLRASYRNEKSNNDRAKTLKAGKEVQNADNEKGNSAPAKTSRAGAKSSSGTKSKRKKARAVNGAGSQKNITQNSGTAIFGTTLNTENESLSNVPADGTGVAPMIQRDQAPNYRQEFVGWNDDDDLQALDADGLNGLGTLNYDESFGTVSDGQPQQSTLADTMPNENETTLYIGNSNSHFQHGATQLMEQSGTQFGGANNWETSDAHGQHNASASSSIETSEQTNPDHPHPTPVQQPFASHGKISKKRQHDFDTDHETVSKAQADQTNAPARARKRTKIRSSVKSKSL